MAMNAAMPCCFGESRCSSKLQKDATSPRVRTTRTAALLPSRTALLLHPPPPPVLPCFVEWWHPLTDLLSASKLPLAPGKRARRRELSARLCRQGRSLRERLGSPGDAPFHGLNGRGWKPSWGTRL